MNDLEFFDELAKEWQRDTAAMEVSRRKALRQYWANRLLFATEFLISAASLWVVWFFWQQDRMIFTVSALVVLFGVAVSVLVSVRERIPLWHWHDWSPEGVLRYRVRLCESTLRVAASCRSTSVVMVLFAAYTWVNAYIAPGSAPAFFPALYTAIALFTVASVEWWARRQRKLRTRELGELKALLDSFDAAQ